MPTPQLVLPPLALNKAVKASGVVIWDKSRTMVTVMLLRVLLAETGVLKVVPDITRLPPSVVMATESFWVPKSASREAKSEYPTIELSRSVVAAVALRLMPTASVMMDSIFFIINVPGWMVRMHVHKQGFCVSS